MPPPAASGRRASHNLCLLLASLWFTPATIWGQPQDSRNVPRPAVEALFLDSNQIHLDGVLDEGVWRQTKPATDFVQREPYVGEPATEQTELRFAFTTSRLYIAITVRAETLIAREQRRDAKLASDDSIAIILDTFLDRRNAYVFETNANGARSDSLVTDEGRDLNPQWDGVWRVATKRTEGGYTAELEIPFATLRFDPSLDRWGLQIVRRIASKNEQNLWSPVGRDADELRISLAGSLTGMAGIKPSQQLQIKPYLTASTSRELGPEAPDDDTTDNFEVGLDAKWAPTRSLAVDLTINTDFAEVEVDEQQVNLTRFPLFFPEKREFFLENAGLFEFGPVKQSFDFDPVLMKVFFSRRIGLDDDGQSIPIRFGARFTGRIGDDWNVGALAVQTRSDREGGETTDFGVARVVRNIGRRSNIGFIATERQGERGSDNRVIGLDTTINPTDRFGIRGFLSHSTDEMAGEMPHETTDEMPAAALDPSFDRSRSGHSAGVSSTYDADAWGLGIETLEVDQDYEPRMGFLLRRDFRFVKPRLQIRPRIEKFGIRNLRMGYAFQHTSQRSTGIMESRAFGGDLIGFETFGGSSFYLWADVITERLFEPFEIRPGVVIDRGRYDFDPAWNFFYWSPNHRRLSVQANGSKGGFFDGDKESLSTGLQYRPNKFFQLALNRSWTEIDLPADSFTTEITRLRTSLSFSPNQRLDALVQLNDAAEVLGVNLRFNWIYRPGADLFIVYNKQWQATSFSNREPTGDQLIVKFTYLFHR